MKAMKVPACSFYALAFCCIATSVLAQAQTRHTGNIIYVMTDGLRWQEVFNGADPSLMNMEHGKVKDAEALKKAYWRDSVSNRRAALMPFLWTVAASQGQIYGNLSKGSDAHVTNTLNFSYPGYSDVLRLRRSSREQQRQSMESKPDCPGVAEPERRISRPHRGLCRLGRHAVHPQRAALSSARQCRLRPAHRDAHDASS
jgi:hypothetical protein